MAHHSVEVWNLYYSKAAAAGLAFARSRIDPAEVVLVHAAPEYLTVEVHDENGNQVAQGKDLQVTIDSPMTRLTIKDGKIERQDIWPTSEDIGRLVILPGGEAGPLLEWWNADDHSEWRWKIEFYNRKEE